MRLCTVGTRDHGLPNLSAAMRDALNARVQAVFPAAARTAVGLDDREFCVGALSDLFRNDLRVPGDGVAGLAPHTDHLVIWRVAGALVSIQQPQVGVVNGQAVYVSRFDLDAPPAVPNVGPIKLADIDGIVSCFSGRAGYHLYGFSNAVDARGAVAIPQGWQRVAVPPANLPLPPTVAPAGVWLEWIGGNDANGLPLIVATGLSAYVVREWIPTTPEAYLNGYQAPGAPLQCFDLPPTFPFMGRMNGRFCDVAYEAPCIHEYVKENNRGGDLLDFLVPERQQQLNGRLNIDQCSMAVMVALAWVWDACNGAAQQNDAYRRWVGKVHAQQQLTCVPDELKLYLGGMRSRRYVEPFGGLWTLCYQLETKVTHARGGHEDLLDFVRNSSAVASYILKLRCAVEMSDQMCHVSNSRLTGYDANFWPQANRDGCYIPHIEETICDRTTYLDSQAFILASIFDHPDAVVRTLTDSACSTLRLREPKQDGAFGLEAMRHMNWMTPQTLRYKSWILYYGIAAPTFIPDSVCRRWLRNAYRTDSWRLMSNGYERGAMFDQHDEIWSAVLTGLVYTDWYPAALALIQFGPSVLVDVSQVRLRHSDGYTQPLMRLNLPYETRVSVVTVNRVGVNSLTRPNLQCGLARAWVDGTILPASQIVYDANGFVQSCNLDPQYVLGENVDLTRTIFAREGITFDPNVGAQGE